MSALHLRSEGRTPAVIFSAIPHRFVVVVFLVIISHLKSLL